MFLRGTIGTRSSRRKMAEFATATVASTNTPAVPPALASKSWSHLYEGKEKYFKEGLIVLQAPVIHGFNRGSKELGFPTANLDMEQLGEIGNALETGIYYGRCILKDIEYQTVVSVGWNPFYHNSKKTIEAHLLHKFDTDFYGENICVHCFGYLRPEANFESLDDLISCINSDIEIAKERMATPTAAEE